MSSRVPACPTTAVSILYCTSASFSFCIQDLLDVIWHISCFMFNGRPVVELVVQQPTTDQSRQPRIPRFAAVVCDVDDVTQADIDVIDGSLSLS